MTSVLQASQDLRIGGRQSGAQYQYALQGDNLQELTHWAPRLDATICASCRNLTDVNSDQQNQGPEANLVIDRATASRLGVTPQTLDNILYDAFGEREIARTYSPMNQYFVVMEVDPLFWQNPDGLRHYLRHARRLAADSASGIHALSPMTTAA